MSKSAFSLRTRTGSRGAALMAAVIALNLLAHGTAHATTPYAQWVMDTFLDQTYKQVVGKLLAMVGLGVETTVAQDGAATRAEINKKAIVDKTVAEGLEAYRQREDLQLRTQTMKESLRQPATTCQTMAAEQGVGTARQNAQARMFSNQTRALARITTNTNAAKTLDAAHATTNEYLCSPDEASAGVCKPTIHSNFAQLAGGDQTAAFLFQARDGSPSYEGGPNGPQAQAADSYIARVVSGGIPPEQLRNVDYSRNPQGRAHVELMRRYTAVMSMVAYSLNQIKEARNPQQGLGNKTKMATVNLPNFAANKSDMSMLEAVQRFVATKFSPTSMRDAATAISPSQMLRDMAQMSAFQLWMDHQTLEQDSRTEALMAHQLALMTEHTLRPQLEAQRRAAAAAR